MGLGFRRDDEGLYFDDRTLIRFLYTLERGPEQPLKPFSSLDSAFATMTSWEQSEPFFLVDDMEQRLTRGKAPAVLEKDGFPFLAIGSAEDRDMWRYQNVGHAP